MSDQVLPAAADIVATPEIFGSQRAVCPATVTPAGASDLGPVVIVVQLSPGPLAP